MHSLCFLVSRPLLTKAIFFVLELAIYSYEKLRIQNYYLQMPPMHEWWMTNPPVVGQVSVSLRFAWITNFGLLIRWVWEIFCWFWIIL